MNFGEVMDILYTIIRESFIFSVPLLIVALGGMFSEKSGVINIALEGAMVLGPSLESALFALWKMPARP